MESRQFTEGMKTGRTDLFELTPDHRSCTKEKTMEPIPPECLEIVNVIQDHKTERADLQAQLQFADPKDKPILAAKIKKLTILIEDKEAELDRCMGKPTSPPRLPCTLEGTAVITTGDPKAPGPFFVSVTFLLTFFGSNRELVTVAFSGASFPTTLTSPVGITCADTVTLRLLEGTGVGKYSPSFPNDIDIPATFAVSHSLSGGIICPLLPAFPSTLPLTPPGLTTRSVPSTLSPTGSLFGAPLNKTSGSITLVGAGVLMGGALGGAPCNVIVSGGTLSCGAQPLP
jgi:hypothetical protein